VGDLVFGEDGKPTKILAKSHVYNNQMYQLTLSDGRTLKVNEDHLNVIIHRRQKRINGQRVNYLDRRVLSSKELTQIKLYSTRKPTKKNPKGRENRVWLPTPEPVQYPEQQVPIDPYVLGLILGDGSIDQVCGFARLHGHIDDLPYFLPYIGKHSGIKKDKRFPQVGRVGILGIGKLLMQLNLNCHGDHKFIPRQYLISSAEQRLAILQGLMDTDGTVYKNGSCAFTSNSLDLVKGVQELVWSLGGIANYSHMDEAYRCSVKLNLPVFRLPRKAQRQHFNCHNRIPLVSIEPIADEPSQCIAVDNEA
jgi:intein/homing endonuclease